MLISFNPLSTNPTKWSNTLKQFVGNLTTNCLSVFDHFVKLALRGLKEKSSYQEPQKVIFNFFMFIFQLFVLQYVLSHFKKSFLTKGLNFSIPKLKLDYSNYLVNFELFLGIYII